MNNLINNNYLIGVILIVIIIYSFMIRQKLSMQITSLFKNDIFRILFLSLLLMFTFDKSPHIAIIVSSVFIFAFIFIAEEKTQEKFKQFKRYMEKN